MSMSRKPQESEAVTGGLDINSIKIFGIYRYVLSLWIQGLTRSSYEWTRSVLELLFEGIEKYFRVQKSQLADNHLPSTYRKLGL